MNHLPGVPCAGLRGRLRFFSSPVSSRKSPGTPAPRPSSKVARYCRERMPKGRESPAQAQAVSRSLASSFLPPLACGLRRGRATNTKPVAKPRSSPTASSVLRNLPPISNLQFQISNPLSSSSPRLRNNPPATKAKHGRHPKSIWTTAASWFSNTPDKQAARLPKNRRQKKSWQSGLESYAHRE